MAKLNLGKEDFGNEIYLSDATPWRVIGSNSADLLSLEAGARAELNLLGGSDVIRVGGNPEEYSVYRQGTTLYLVYQDNAIITLAATKQGKTFIFADGSERVLKIDTASSSLLLGQQVITTSSVPLDGSDDDPQEPNPGNDSNSIQESADWSDKVITLAEMNSGTHADGSIGFEGDVDWIKVHFPEAGKAYDVELEGIDGSLGKTLSEPFLYGIYDAQANRIVGSDYDSGLGTNAQLTFTPNTSGDYFVSVAGERSATGTYRLHVTEQDDFLQTVDTLAKVTVGGQISGAIDPRLDYDWIKVNLPNAGKAYDVEVHGVDDGGGTLLDPMLQGIYDDNGQKIIGGDANSGVGTNPQLTITPNVSGDYYISVYGRSNNEGTYTLSVEDNDDYHANTNTTAEMGVGESFIGEVDTREDIDWIRLIIPEANKAYDLELHGAETSKGTLTNPRLYGIFDEAMNRVIPGDDNSGIGYNAQVTFTAATAGVYYVSVGGNGATEGLYTLVVEDSDDYLANTQTSAHISVPGMFPGVVNARQDRDWIKVVLPEAGKAYDIELHGTDTDGGTLSNPEIGALFDETMTRVLVGDRDSGTGNNAQVTFTPSTAGTYYIEVGGTYNAEGSYTLQIQDDDEFLANFSTQGKMSVGQSLSGTINSRQDVDWIAIDLVSGQSYEFNFQGADSESGTLIDPEIAQIRDESGRRVASGDRDGGVGRDASLIFTPEASGEYFIELLGRSNTAGTYLLAVDLL